MRALIVIASLLGLWLIAPARADDDAKKKDKPVADKTDQDTKKDDTKPAKKKPAKKDDDDSDQPKKEPLRYVGQVGGKIVTVDPQAKKLTIAVPYSRLTGNPRNPGIDTRYTNIDVYMSDDVVVRRKFPPPAVDDRGRQKRYTQKELKELRGPKGSWGYNADAGDLRKDEVVLLLLGRHKSAAHGKIKSKDLEQELASVDNRPLAYQVRILVEPLP